MEPVTKYQEVKSVEGYWSSEGHRLMAAKVTLDNGDTFTVRPDNVPALGQAVTVTYARAVVDEPLPFDEPSLLSAARAAVADFGSRTS